MTNAELSELYKIPKSTIEKWKGKLKKGKTLETVENPLAERLSLIDNLWFVADQ